MIPRWDNRATEKAIEKGQKTLTAGHVLEAVKMLNWEEGKQLGKLLREELKGTYELGPLPVSDLRLMEGGGSF